MVEVLPPSATSFALGNAGVSAVDYEENVSVVDMGEGAGFYISATTIDGDEVPLLTETQVSTAYFAPAGLRSFVMNLLNVDPNIRMTVSAPANQSEFEASGAHTTSSQTEIGYFFLEQSSVSYEDNGNSIVDLTLTGS